MTCCLLGLSREMEIKIQNLIDDARCYEAVRDLRWPEKTFCLHPDCGSCQYQASV